MSVMKMEHNPESQEKSDFFEVYIKQSFDLKMEGSVYVKNCGIFSC